MLVSDDHKALPDVSYSYSVEACNECDCTMGEAETGHRASGTPSPDASSRYLPLLVRSNGLGPVTERTWLDQFDATKERQGSRLISTTSA